MSYDEIITNSENKIKKMHNSEKTVILLIYKDINHKEKQVNNRNAQKQMRIGKPRHRH